VSILAQLDLELDDVELDAYEADLMRLLIESGIRSALLLGWIQDEPWLVAQLEPEERARMIDSLDRSIAAVEALRASG
jgi:hypothetical protein